uniref:Glutathione S-transferase epsilon 2 n=1 Tax=Lasioderma serricorne TaxID=295660 RepID=A0A8F2Q4U2_9COLE|nr:glutathione S-transferase epsilon 2 [Lasioderma serricorne]
MTIEALNVPVERKIVNIHQGENLTPEYLKLNPQHTVPTYQEEDGFVVWDSHAINAYLVGKYASDDSLYPKDLRKRAHVDQRLHFESSVLFPRLLAIARPILRHGAKTVPKEKAEAVHEGYDFLETFLEGRNFVVGDEMTIADFHTVATITSLNVVVPIASNRYPNILAWIARMQQLPYYKENQDGLDKFTVAIKSILS